MFLTTQSLTLLGYISIVSLDWNISISLVVFRIVTTLKSSHSIILELSGDEYSYTSSGEYISQNLQKD